MMELKLFSNYIEPVTENVLDISWLLEFDCFDIWPPSTILICMYT